jgi:hypothetical protein
VCHHLVQHATQAPQVTAVAVLEPAPHLRSHVPVTAHGSRQARGSVHTALQREQQRDAQPEVVTWGARATTTTTTHRGVPMTVCAWLAFVSALATPRSPILTTLSGHMKMLAGLMSRWMTAVSWMA